VDQPDLRTVAGLCAYASEITSSRRRGRPPARGERCRLAS